MALTLSDIPTEVLELIVDELPMVKISNKVCGPPDLMSLRLVSREIYLKTKGRFGLCFLRKLIVPVPMKRGGRVQGILNTAVLRDRVKHIEMHIDYSYFKKLSSKHSNECEAFEEYLTKEHFKQHLEELWEKADQARSLKILSTWCGPRRIPSTPRENRLRDNWRQLLRQVLSSLFAQESFRLEDLQIGDSEAQDYISTSTSQLQGFAKDSNILSKLTNLRVFRLVGEEKTDSTSTPSILNTQTLADFVALAPNLKALSYTNFSVLLTEKGNCIPTSLPHLKELTLTSIPIPEAMILQGLQANSPTLKRLRLCNVQLIDNVPTSKNVFHFLSNSLELDVFEICDLVDNDYSVLFTPLVQERPLILDSDLDPRITRWSRDTKDLISQAVAEEWVWIEHDTDYNGVVLDKEEGDDVQACLAVLDQGCPMVQIQ
jgi:hypothetical protein